MNKKGFTLVELLAVIVVLAIIMIIAIPSILGTMSDAQRGTFKVYAEKVLNKAQERYQSDILFGEPKNKKTYGYCYELESGLEMTSTGNYKGYVIVVQDSHLVPTFYVTLSDNNFSVQDYLYAELADTEYDPPVSGTLPCPNTFTVPGV